MERSCSRGALIELSHRSSLWSLTLTPQADESFDSDSDDEADEVEDTGDVTMVPMADMLNAKFEHDNVGFLRAFSDFME